MAQPFIEGAIAQTFLGRKNAEFLAGCGKMDSVT
jgi:hypothetical protein